MVKVCAIIVTYNRLRILKKCIMHLLNQQYKLNDVIIVDNDSSDGTNNYLKSISDSRIHYRILNKNIGGSGGFSLGTKLAFENTSDKYFWLMDDDALPTTKSLKALISACYMLKGHFGFLCSNVKSLNDTPVNIPNTSEDWTKYLPLGLPKVKQASFVSLFLSRNVVKHIGLPIKQMFIWGDDMEYTRRISSKYESYFVPNSIIIHDSIVVHDSTKNAENIFNSNRPQLYKYAYRNYLYNARKYNGIWGFLDRLTRDIIRLIQTPFLSKNKRFKRFYNLLIGIIHGLYFNPTVEFPLNKNNIYHK